MSAPVPLASDRADGLGGWSELERISECILCAVRDLTRVRGIGHLARCRSCGHLMLDPRPTQAAIAASYDRGDGVHGSWREEEAGRRQMWRKRAARTLASVPGPGRALDVGAGFGDFLAELTIRGWQVSGTEVSGAAAEVAGNRTSADIFVGQIADFNAPKGEFDLITMWHVLEHLPDPGAALGRCAALLAKGGSLIVAVPNDGLFPRFAAALLRQALLRSTRRSKAPGYSWRFPLPGQEVHLSYFSVPVLAAAMRRVALEPDEIGIDDHTPMPTARSARRFRLETAVCRTSRIDIGRTIYLHARKA